VNDDHAIFAGALRLLSHVCDHIISGKVHHLDHDIL